MTRPAVAALAAAAVLLAACSSSGGGGSDNPVVTPPSVPSTPSATLGPPVTSTAPSSTPVATPSTSATKPKPTATPSSPPKTTTTNNAKPTAKGTCSAAQLTITLLREGSVPNQQLAALVFTNSSKTACTISGYPSAQLLLDGKPIGKPAGHKPSGLFTIRLPHNASAQATLSATTTCQAPLSDHVRVSAPGQTRTVDLPDKMRACVLAVTAVGPATQ